MRCENCPHGHLATGLPQSCDSPRQGGVESSSKELGIGRVQDAGGSEPSEGQEHSATLKDTREGSEKVACVRRMSASERR